MALLLPVGVSLDSVYTVCEKRKKKIKATIRDKLVKFARSNTLSHPAALWSIAQSIEARQLETPLIGGEALPRSLTIGQLLRVKLWSIFARI